jgi:hypothetical protein
MVHVDQALFLFLDQVLERLVHLHLPLFCPLAEDVRQHVFDVDVHLLHALIREDLERRKIALANIDFHHAVIELALAQLLPEFLARAIR